MSQPARIRPPARHTAAARVLAAFGACCAALLLARHAAAAGETARQLLDQAKHLNDTTRSWKDRSQKLTLHIVNAQGGERTRDLVMKTQRNPGGEDKTLTVFLTPAEVRGTSFLQFAHRDRDAEQWLFLPELKRVRQITARSKNESFMGTDFSYRDLELLTDVLEWTEDEARSQLVGSDTIDGTDAAIVELTPLRKDVGYRKIVIALSRPDLVIRRMEFFADEDKAKKLLKLDRTQQIGAVPTATLLEMSQPAAGTHTTVNIADVKYDQSLPEDLFTQRALERGADNAD